MIQNNIVGTIEQFMHEYYIPKVVEGLIGIDERVLDEISDKIAQRVRRGGCILAFGNGGSDAIAESFILSLEQRINPRFQFDTYSNPRPGEASTATGIDLIFNRRILRSARQGDLVVLVSASGDSENINRASIYCKASSVETISVSGNGKISYGPAKSDCPIIVPLQDQQIIEDVTLGILYLLGEVTASKVNGFEYDIAGLKKLYVKNFNTEAGLLSARRIDLLAQDVVNAYKTGHQVRIDGLNSGLLLIAAAHMQHNLKWDAFQGVIKRPPNRVSSGIPQYHFSGVSNDGGDGYNYAMEIEDNYERDDVEVVFGRHMGSLEAQTLSLAAQRKGMKIHPFFFCEESEYVVSNVAQSILHIAGRVINAYLLSESNPAEFGSRLKHDLAMLRQKRETMRNLARTYESH